MNVETPLNANAQFAEAGETGMRALDHPAMSSEPLLAFQSATGDTGRDAARPQVTLTACEVIHRPASAQHSQIFLSENVCHRQLQRA
ncbi:hypothetical protein C7412_109109 [Paraburkholderia silvatlantica]|nr:hypothetical protein C7412_109109 [Paraburkholderia silvatlantica]